MAYKPVLRLRKWVAKKIGKSSILIQKVYQIIRKHNIFQIIKGFYNFHLSKFILSLFKGK